VQTEVVVNGPRDRSLTKRFGGLTAINGLDFAVEAWEFLGFLGPYVGRKG